MPAFFIAMDYDELNTFFANKASRQYHVEQVRHLR